MQRTLIRPPSSRLGPLTDEERKGVISESPISGTYDKEIDRESAYEILMKRKKEMEERRAETGGTVSGRRDTEYVRHGEFRVPPVGGRTKTRSKSKRRSSRRQTASEAFFKSLMRSLGTGMGRLLPSIIKILLGRR